MPGDVQQGPKCGQAGESRVVGSGAGRNNVVVAAAKLTVVALKFHVVPPYKE